MSKAIFVQVTIYDETTQTVEQQIVRHYDGSYGYEVEAMLRKLGEELAPKVDPYHGRGD
jgi:transposase